MKRFSFRPGGLQRSLILACLWAIPFALYSHPGSGIAVDEANIFFVDTGFGVWKLSRDGKTLSPMPGEAWHFMDIDRSNREVRNKTPRVPEGDLHLVGTSPRLVLSSSFPVAVGNDGTIYYPEAYQKESVRIMKLPPTGRATEVIILPRAFETNPEGEKKPVPWIHGLCVAPDGSLYYSEQSAVRKVGADGKIMTIAEDIKIENPIRPPGAGSERTGAALRSLAVAPDGTVYAAAAGYSALLKLSSQGKVTPILRAGDTWAPTGVAISGQELFVLEYLHVDTHRREDWYPRIRKVSANGTVTLLKEVKESDRQAAKKSK